MTTLRRMADDELSSVLTMLATSGGTARSTESWRQDRMTALLLGERGNPTAAMPISQRTVAVSPGRSLSAGWLSSNQFATRMSLRRQTRDTAHTWPDLLPALDALLVVRRDDSGFAGAARWYAQTGFHDVLSIRCLYLDMDQPPETGGGVEAAGARTPYRVEVATVGGGSGKELGGTLGWDPARWQSEMLAVYRDVYAGYGGAPVRTENFWHPTLQHHYYRQHYHFQVVGLWSASSGARTLMGYAVVGWSGWHSKRPRMDILELATRQWDTAVATELLRTTAQLAWSKNVHQVRAVIAAHDPYRAHLARSGFVDRWGYVMLAKWLHAQAYLDRLAPTLPSELAGLSLRLNTPGELPLRMDARSAISSKTLDLQGDARTTTRLLLQRLDVDAALRGTEGTLFSPDGAVSPQDATRLSMTFPWTPWVFHMLDYI